MEAFETRKNLRKYARKKVRWNKKMKEKLKQKRGGRYAGRAIFKCSGHDKKIALESKTLVSRVLLEIFVLENII